MKKIFTFCFALISTLSFSQDFGMDDSVKFISKTTASITPPHEYFQFNNFSGDSLPIRWKINQSLSYYPSQWGFALQDNETYHNPIIDSNDIVIPDTTGTMDKIIINVFHNQQAGYGELVIDLINLDSTQEIHTIKFEIEITQANSISENLLSQIHLFPNPANETLTLEIPDFLFIHLELIDLTGRPCFKNEDLFNTSTLQISLDGLSSGTYFIQLTTDKQERITVPFVRQ